jgi:hypothetical protein
VYDAAFSDEKHGLVHTPRTIYTTADGGSTWVSVQIDLTNEPLKGFSYVLSVAAADPNHMAIVLSQGNSPVHDYRLLTTQDGGLKWTIKEIPSTGLSKLSTHGGEYWFAGFEVIEKDKPGGGYGVPLVMHSSDADKWTHLERWAKSEFSACNSQGCLYWDGAAVQLPPANPPTFWTFAPERVVTAKWAVAKDGICSLGTSLRCTAVTKTQSMPPYLNSSSPIEPLVSAPALDALPTQGLQCISCDFARVMVTPDFQGVAEVQLKLHIGQNGLVEQVEVLHANNVGIGERLSSAVRSWIFVPFEKDGVAHPAITEVKLRVQAIKTR